MMILNNKLISSKVFITDESLKKLQKANFIKFYGLNYKHIIQIFIC